MKTTTMQVSVMIGFMTCLYVTALLICVVGSWLGAKLTGRQWITPWKSTDSVWCKIKLMVINPLGSLK